MFIKIWDFLKEEKFFTAFLIQILTIIVIFLLRIIGIDIGVKFFKFINFFKKTIFSIFGFKEILLYTDCSDYRTTTLSLAYQLKIKLKKNKLFITPIINPEHLLRTPLLKWQVHAIIIILTDVGTLSSDKRKRDKIQKNIISFCHKGGLVILGHDVLYRRSKNEMLQKLAGCKLIHFMKTQKALIYKRNDDIAINRKTKSIDLLSNIPSKIYIDDGECVYGEWADDVEYIYISDNVDRMKTKYPVVTRRTAGMGVVCWLNSADHTDKGPPKPIAEPKEEFIQILVGLLLYSNNKNFKNQS